MSVDAEKPPERGSVSSSTWPCLKEEVKQSPTSSRSSTPAPPDLASSNQAAEYNLSSSNADAEKGLTRITTAVDWSSTSDPGNPHDWPLRQKLYHTAIVAGIAFVGTFASSAFTPGIMQVSADFHVSQEVVLVAYSPYVLGLAVGAPSAAPASEFFGRKMVYLISMPIFSLFILGTGFAPNIGALIVLRFLAGVFGSPSLSIGSGTIADIWPPAQRSTPMSCYVATPFLGPALGPLVGSFATTSFGWRRTSWCILFIAVAFLTPVRS